VSGARRAVRGGFMLTPEHLLMLCHVIAERGRCDIRYVDQEHAENRGDAC
jgi:hypothetical protein